MDPSMMKFVMRRKQRMEAHHALMGATKAAGFDESIAVPPWLGIAQGTAAEVRAVSKRKQRGVWLIGLVAETRAPCKYICMVIKDTYSRPSEAVAFYGTLVRAPTDDGPVKDGDELSFDTILTACCLPGWTNGIGEMPMEEMLATVRAGILLPKKLLFADAGIERRLRSRIRDELGLKGSGVASPEQTEWLGKQMATSIEVWERGDSKVSLEELEFFAERFPGAVDLKSYEKERRHFAAGQGANPKVSIVHSGGLVRNDPVKIVGLSRRAELNGQIASWVRYTDRDPRKAKAQIIVDGSAFKLKLSNIEAAFDPNDGIGLWLPEAEILRDTPLEWFVRRPSTHDDFRMTQLWGWRTDLFNAVSVGDADIISPLCREHGEIATVYCEMRLLLSKAASAGHTGAMAALIDDGGVHVDGCRAPAPPPAAASQPGGLSVYRLHQQGAGDDGHAAGTTPLFQAVYNGRAAAVKLLLDRGADPSIESGTGIPPLHMAAHRCNKDVIALLLMGGASVTQIDSHGQRAVDVARNESQHPDASNAMRWNKVATMLEPAADGGAAKAWRCEQCDARGCTLTCPCKTVKYCSAECQKRGWKSHKNEHKALMKVSKQKKKKKKSEEACAAKKLAALVGDTVVVESPGHEPVT